MRIIFVKSRHNGIVSWQPYLVSLYDSCIIIFNHGCFFMRVLIWNCNICLRVRNVFNDKMYKLQAIAILVSTRSILWLIGQYIEGLCEHIRLR